MRKAFISLSVIILGGIIAIGAAVGGYLFNIDQQQIDYLQIQLEQQEAEFGAINFVRADPTTLSSSISASASSIVLADFTTPDGTELAMTNFGEVGYITIEPGTSNIEFASFTGITQDGSSTKATLTGVTRGLKFVSPYTTDATLKIAHAGGSRVIVSNPPQLYNQSAFKLNDETIAGTWTFTNTDYPRISASSTLPTDDREFTTKFYVDSITAAGASPLTETVAGIGIGASITELMAGTATSTYNAVIYSLLALSEDFSATSTAANLVPVTRADGDLDAAFIGQDQNYTWSGTHTFSTSTVTFNSAVDINNTVDISGAVNASSTVTIDTGNLIVGGNVLAGVDIQEFTSDGTWTKPSAGEYVFVQAWGGGGSGGTGSTGSSAGGGGGGGIYMTFWFDIDDLTATSTVDIGAGGAAITADNTNGNAGANTTFGSYLTAYAGGGGGANGAGGGGGGGGGALAGGTTASTATGGNGGSPAGGVGGVAGTNRTAGGSNDGLGGAGGGAADSDSSGAGANGGSSAYGGGGGGGGEGSANQGGGGGGSVFGGGGGGGGGQDIAGGGGGNSIHGGNGGAGAIDAADATDGTQAGGGGGGAEGGDSGKGGDGKVIIITF